MQDFWLYFQLGWQHILDWQGYDHILFVVVLCVTYALSDWKKVLILVTAFTIGHSITLALSVFKVISLHTPLIEFLIPVTILMTAAGNILNKRPKKEEQISNTCWLYFSASSMDWASPITSKVCLGKAAILSLSFWLLIWVSNSVR